MSHNPYIVWTDLSKLTFTATGVESASHPLSNLNDYNPNTYWQSSVTTAGPGSNYLNWSFPTQSVDTVVIGGINNIFSEYSSSMNPVSRGVYWKDSAGSDHLLGWLTASADNTYMAVQSGSLTGPTSYMFVELSQLDIGGSPQGVKIANVFSGKAVKFTTPYNYGARTENAEYATNVVTTLSGQTKTSQTYAGRIVYEIDFTLQDNTLKNDFQAFIKGIRGALYPFCFIDGDDTIRYMHAQDYVPATTVFYGRHNIESFTMKTHESTF